MKTYDKVLTEAKRLIKEAREDGCTVIMLHGWSHADSDSNEFWQLEDIDEAIKFVLGKPIDEEWRLYVDGSTEDEEGCYEDCVFAAEDDDDPPASKEAAYHLGAKQVGQVGCITTDYNGTPLKKPRWYKISTSDDEIDIDFYADGYDPESKERQQVMQNLWVEVPNVEDAAPTFRMSDYADETTEETVKIYPKES